MKEFMLISISDNQTLFLVWQFAIICFQFTAFPLIPERFLPLCQLQSVREIKSVVTQSTKPPNHR
jgi:hypothetical protein